MRVSVDEVADLLSINKDRVEEEAIKTLLEKRLMEIRAIIAPVYRKYNVSSLRELDKRINRGELGETDTFEDFTELDSLESEADRIKELLAKL